ncbi:MAG TPA: hypothetical protein VLH79_04220 [Chthonomonadales bacterium]|nr:hypothetical protein [Chthonomonadales bacterium]
MTAVVILAVLAAVQAVWWRGLVWRAPLPSGVSMGAGGPSGGVTPALGRRDVLVDTLAGAPDAGDADGPGRHARFDGPAGVTVGPDGALYVADSRNHRIRRVAPDGRTTTVAGGEPGYADGPVATARFLYPCGIAAGPDGALYVADTGNHRIRVVRDGAVTTLAGSDPGFASGRGSAARFRSPAAIAYQGGDAPRLWVADVLNERIRPVGLDGVVGDGWRTPGPPAGVAVRPGHALVAAVPAAGLLEQGGAAAQRSRIEAGDTITEFPPTDLVLASPTAICAGPEGLYVADDRHAAVFDVRGGVAHVLAGAASSAGRLEGWIEGSGAACSFGRIGGIAADGKGRIYVSDTSNNAIRRILLPEAQTPDDLEDDPGSRDRWTDEDLRGGDLWDPGYQPPDRGRGVRPSGPQRGGQEHPDVDPRNPPGPDHRNGTGRRP